MTGKYFTDRIVKKSGFISAIEARFKNGILTLTVSKTPGAKPAGRKIAIK